MHRIALHGTTALHYLAPERLDSRVAQTTYLKIRACHLYTYALVPLEPASSWIPYWNPFAWVVGTSGDAVASETSNEIANTDRAAVRVDL